MGGGGPPGAYWLLGTSYHKRSGVTRLNTFGTPTFKFPLVQPHQMARVRARFGRSAVEELKYANSYYSLSGLWPDVGWILLDRSSYVELDPYATNLQLEINDLVTISNLTVVQARCLSSGITSDQNSIYLVQLTNGIGALYNQWFQTPVNVQYNVRAPAYPDSYYDSTLNSGTAWTWDLMVRDLWQRAPLQLGTYPGLPITPTGTPEDYIFVGVSLWEAITHILTHLGLTVTGNYPSLGISVSGSADASLTALQAKYAGALEDDMQYLDGGSGRVPGSVVVYFNRRNEYYGTEQTVTKNTLQWQTTPAYSVTILAPAQFSGAVGVGHLWSDFTVRYDVNNFPLAADVATAATEAAERAAQFYKDIFRGTQGYMRQVYAGALPFETGSLVDGVRWYTVPSLPQGAWRTEVIRGYTWPEAMFMPTKQWGN